jgi:hypothetical protein
VRLGGGGSDRPSSEAGVGEESRHPRESEKDEPAIVMEGSSCKNSGDRPTYATRLRVVLLLSLLSWAVVIALVWWLLSL